MTTQSYKASKPGNKDSNPNSDSNSDPKSNALLPCYRFLWIELGTWINEVEGENLPSESKSMNKGKIV